MDGVIVVDKPSGWTSHDVVGKLRRLANERRIGHLGTLDPMATGVLPLIIGRATRLARFFTDNSKIYDSLVRFGITTDTYDAAGEVLSSNAPFHVTREQLEQALDAFRGTFLQTPPPISAKKVGGVPAYKLARKKVPVTLVPVEVTVSALEVLEFDGCRVRLRIDCGGGTYVRSIAHDLGQALGCGAMLESLRRLASGDFKIEQARTIEQLQAEGAGTALIPASKLLPEFPSELVDQVTASHIRQGKDFRVSPFRARPNAKYVKAVDAEGELIAIGEIRLPNLYHPILVL
jgi:tRNA pseudouridine55 synthase